jgi:hypothetical protein
MGQQINQYTIDRATFGDDDYYDIDYWDGATYQTAKIKGSVIKAGIQTGTLLGLYSQTSASLPITNTTTETSLFNGATSVGTLSVDRDVFQVGDSYHAKVGGYLSCINNSDINIRVKSGSVILSDSGVITLPTMTNKVYEIELDFTIRQIGGTGVAEIITMGEINYVQNSGTSFEGYNFCNVNNTTFDTTIINTLDITWEWKTASASNSVLSDIVNLRKTY